MTEYGTQNAVKRKFQLDTRKAVEIRVEEGQSDTESVSQLPNVLVGGVAITKYHGLVDLNKRNVFSHSSVGQKSGQEAVKGVLIKSTVLTTKL